MRSLIGTGLLLLCAAALAAADPFTGHYTGSLDGDSVELHIYSDSAGYYDGELFGDELHWPLFGRRFGENMMGRIGPGDAGFIFRARIMGALLVMWDEQGNRRLVLQRAD